MLDTHPTCYIFLEPFEPIIEGLRHGREEQDRHAAWQVLACKASHFPQTLKCCFHLVLIEGLDQLVHPRPIDVMGLAGRNLRNHLTCRSSWLGQTSKVLQQALQRHSQQGKCLVSSCGDICTWNRMAWVLNESMAGYVAEAGMR